MINLYSGTPGSGKSLHTAEYIYFALRRREPIISNFPMSLPKKWRGSRDKFYFYLPNEQISPSKLISFSRKFFNGKPVKEGALLLVLDECQLLFNSRDWQKSGRAEWLSFFTQHRHYGFDIILIAQFDRMIDKQIRSLIEYEFIHRKVSNFGFFGKIMSFLSFGNLFVAVKVWYPLKEKVSSEFFHARKKYYRLYDSYADFGIAENKIAAVPKKKFIPIKTASSAPEAVTGAVSAGGARVSQAPSATGSVQELSAASVADNTFEKNKMR